MNKDLLISFLNALFDGEEVIEDVSYPNAESLGISRIMRRAIFDVLCQTSDGSHIIVEMQNVFENFYKDRTTYYSIFPIAELAKKGELNDIFDKVYTVGVLNFSFDEDYWDKQYMNSKANPLNVKTKDIFNDKLTDYYIEIVNFQKSLNELDSLFDKWVFSLRNMRDLTNRPAELQERIFGRLFDAAQIARLSPEKLRQYEDSVKAYRDIDNAVKAARKIGIQQGLEDVRAQRRAEAFAQGIAEGKKEACLATAKNLKAMAPHRSDCQGHRTLCRGNCRHLT